MTLMSATSPESTVAFARILGIIFLVAGVQAVFFRKSMSAAIAGVSENPPLFWVWGFINLVLGAAIVAFYNTWSLDWRVIITISGWGGILKGTLLMLFPDSARALYRWANKPVVLTTDGAVACLLGLSLLYIGLRA